MADTIRDRSASPTREPKSKKQKTSGFKWKEKKSVPDREEPAQGLERGYRERETNEKRRRTDRDHGESNGHDEPESKRPSRTIGDSVTIDTDQASTPAQQSSDAQPNPPLKPSDVASKFGSKAIARSKNNMNTNHAPSPNTPQANNESSTTTTTTAKKSKPASAPAPVSNEPMIIVNVNDRLGTKAAIPCLASDSIKNFKAMVAAHIGRQPHEIMLKRQGERPFKDVLTLQDYGVSNGVQLDLELDTGD